MLPEPLVKPQPRPICTPWRTPRSRPHPARCRQCGAGTELSAADDPGVGNALIEQARRRATPSLIDVLHRYPPAPVGKSRVAHLMKTLDSSLRTLR